MALAILIAMLPASTAFALSPEGVTAKELVPLNAPQPAFTADDQTMDTLSHNDHFANAEGVPGGANSQRTHSTSGYTLQTGEPRPCGNVAATAWYSITPAYSGTLVITTTGSNYDTVLAAYTGSWGALSTRACNDDWSGLLSRIAFSVTAGTTYWIQAGGYSGRTGSLVVNFAPPIPPAPVNDHFANAIGVSSMSFTDTQSTLAATVEAGEPQPCAAIGATVWYAYTSPYPTAVTVDTFGSDYDTALAVYTGPSLDDLTPIECNDDTDTLQSHLVFSAVPDVTYWIQAGGFSGSKGALVLNLEASILAPANDDRANATIIESVPYSDVAYTHAATTEMEEPAPCGEMGATVWYAYTPMLPGLMTVDTLGSDFDTVLALYAEIDGRLVYLGCNDDDAGTYQSFLSFPVLPNVTYYIQAGGYAGSTGTLVLNVN